MITHTRPPPPQHTVWHTHRLGPQILIKRSIAPHNSLLTVTVPLKNLTNHWYKLWETIYGVLTSEPERTVPGLNPVSWSFMRYTHTHTHTHTLWLSWPTVSNQNAKQCHSQHTHASRSAVMTHCKHLNTKQRHTKHTCTCIIIYMHTERAYTHTI